MMYSAAGLALARRLFPTHVQGYQQCSTCGLFLHARNRKRHTAACNRRRREDYLAWDNTRKQIVADCREWIDRHEREKVERAREAQEARRR